MPQKQLSKKTKTFEKEQRKQGKRSPCFVSFRKEANRMTDSVCSNILLCMFNEKTRIITGLLKEDWCFNAPNFHESALIQWHQKLLRPASKTPRKVHNKSSILWATLRLREKKKAKKNQTYFSSSKAKKDLFVSSSHMENVQQSFLHYLGFGFFQLQSKLPGSWAVTYI